MIIWRQINLTSILRQIYIFDSLRFWYKFSFTYDLSSLLVEINQKKIKYLEKERKFEVEES